MAGRKPNRKMASEQGRVLGLAFWDKNFMQGSFLLIGRMRNHYAMIEFR